MPTRDTPWPAGTPCWVDIGVPDVAAARDFYSALFGWDYEGGSPEFGGYLTVTSHGRAAAGMGPQTDPDDPPRWTTYLATDDVAAGLERVTAAGGRVVVPAMQVGPMGTMGLAADPQGAVFGLWQSGLNTGVQVSGEPGALVWNEAAVADPAAAREFYSAVFGYRWQELPDAGDYQLFTLDERPLGGLGGLTEGAPAGWSACFGVADTDTAVATVQQRGGSVVMPPEDTPYGRFAVVVDPWGAAFSVMRELPG